MVGHLCKKKVLIEPHDDPLNSLLQDQHQLTLRLRDLIVT